MSFYRPLMAAAAVLLQVFLLGSCTVESLDESATGKNGSTLISFEGSMSVGANGFIDGSKGATRGARADAENLSFGVSGSVYPAANDYSTALCSNYFRNVNVTTADGETSYLWPSNEYRLSFYAYSPYNGTGITLGSADNTGKMQYTYSASATVASQVDFCTADVTNVSCPSTDPVELDFSHRTSEFTFRVRNNTPNTITVNSVRLMSFYKTGVWDGDSWDPDEETESSFTLTVGQPVASGGILDVTGTSNHFFMVPQTKAAGADMIRLEIVKDAATTVFLHQHPTAFVAEAGHSYAFDLTISSGMEVDTSSDISSWEMSVDYVDYATGSINPWDPTGNIDHAEDGGIDPWSN